MGLLSWARLKERERERGRLRFGLKDKKKGKRKSANTIKKGKEETKGRRRSNMFIHSSIIEKIGEKN